MDEVMDEEDVCLWLNIGHVTLTQKFMKLETFPKPVASTAHINKRGKMIRYHFNRDEMQPWINGHLGFCNDLAQAFVRRAYG
jgi:hypothetical protein